MWKSNNSKRLLLIILFFCMCGVFVASKLLQIHILTHTDPTFHSICAVSDGVNCETVALSPYSVFFNIPVCVWGIWGYIIILGFAFRLWVHRSHNSTQLWGIFSMLTIVSVVVSFILAIISFTKIDSICLFCLSSYLINLVLLLLTFIAKHKLQISLFTAIMADIRYLVRFPGRTVLLVVACAAPMIGFVKTVEPYWEQTQWLDIQALTSGITNEGAHWNGATTPTVTIVEFSDYQCPHCRMAHKKVRALVAKYSDDVRLVHRQYPLDMQCNRRVTRKFHEYACTFALATECAALQNKFWQMSDAIFGAQETVKANDVALETIAVKLGLNRSQFLNCLNKKETLPKVKFDIEAAIKNDVTGTPTFFIGHKKFVGGISETQLKIFLE